MNLYCRECYRTVSPRIDRDAIPATEFTINGQREYICHDCLSDPEKDCCFERRDFGECRCAFKGAAAYGLGHPLNPCHAAHTNERSTDAYRHTCGKCGGDIRLAKVASS